MKAICIDRSRRLWSGLTLSDADIDRFWAKVAIVEPTECWLWTGSLAMRADYAGERATMPELAARFGVHVATVHRAVTRETWGHVA